MHPKVRINENFGRLATQYLFTEIEARAAAYTETHSDKKLLRLGIGDVTLPLPPTVVKAMAKAAREMGTPSGFRGYPPGNGYDFLRRAIAARYNDEGIAVDENEVFISDGAKSDIGDLCALFGDTPILAVTPAYPVYRDLALLSGRNIVYVAGTRENGFLPLPDACPETPHLILLCSPGNPTGTAYTEKGLRAWIRYAENSGSLILFDVAYRAFMPPTAVRSVYAVCDARHVAVEYGSFSKSAGFTGIRCGYAVIPSALRTADGHSVAALHMRRKAIRSNGVSYITQRGAEAALSEKGRRECENNLLYYRENAALLAAFFKEKNFFFTGGDVSPYLFVACPEGMDSRAFFDLLLNDGGIVTTPGIGFGEAGEGYVRFSAFAQRDDVLLAVERMKNLL